MNTPLVSASELAARPADAPLVIIDARQSRAAYEAGHLRGAIHADLESDLSAAREPGADPRRGGRHPLPSVERWAATLGRWGVTPETDVVVYDDQAGANAAARAWWMLRAAGHERVAVLDGGWQAAVDAGLPTSREASWPSVREPYPVRAWQLPFIEAERVDALRSDPSWRVLDVRSAERFRGETEPFDPIAGHIPGAVNLPYASNLENGVFRKPSDLRAQYESLLDGRSAGNLVVHCGSGVTACHTLLALEAAGLRGAALYVGSWGEWCRNDRPRATGTD